MFYESWFWIFNGIVAVLLMVDLFGFNRKAHVIHMKEAVLMSIFWIAVAMLFNLYVYEARGPEDSIKFLTGYLMEKALSIDNLFVFLLIFTYFQVPSHVLHRALFWGIFGAIVMRALFIFFGISLIQKFHGIIYVFGLFLVYTAIKMVWEKDKKFDPESNLLIRFVRKLIPMTPNYIDGKYLVKIDGRYFATPLLIVLVAIETTDVIFAVDSIPAIIGITSDPFLVYTSNILAILGLRALYFALAPAISLFHHLHYGLAFVLAFIGFKMLISGYVTIPVSLSLAVLLAALAISILTSILYPKTDKTVL